MPRPPNYKQNKQRREDSKRKKNEEAQARKAARKAPGPGDVDPGSSPPPTHPKVN